MERDPNISKLVKEAGLARAPDNFTDQVMKRIGIAGSKATYKPIIGRGGRILIVLFVLGVVMVSIFYPEEGGRLIENLRGITGFKLQIPQMKLNADFLSNISISTWLVSTVVALFVLLLTDAGLSRRKRLV